MDQDHSETTIAIMHQLISELQNPRQDKIRARVDVEGNILRVKRETKTIEAKIDEKESTLQLLEEMQTMQ
jgi:hypothetical protein